METIVVISEDEKLKRMIKERIDEEIFFFFPLNMDEACDFFRNKPVDITILDTFLRNITLDEVKRRLGKYFKSVTFIGIVRKGREEWEEELEEAGIKIWLETPFTFKNVRRVISLAEEKMKFLGELRSTEKREKRTILSPPSEASFNSSFSSYPYHQEAIRKFSKALTYILDLSRLIDLIITAFLEVFEVNKISILMKNKDGRGYQVESSIGILKEQIKEAVFYKDKGIFGWLLREGRIIQKSESGLEEEVKREMSLLGAEIVLPMEVRGNIFGAITVGKKVTGEKFSMEELKLLYTMANYSAIALHNALLYREIDHETKYYQFILDSLPSGFLSVNEKGRIININKKGKEILDILESSEEMTDLSIQKAGSIVSDLILKTLKGTKEVNREEIYLPRGKKILGVTTALVKDEKNNTKGAVMFFRDLTPVKVKEKEAKNKEEEILWKRIAERIAHEVRNPLVSIKTFSQLLPDKYHDVDFRNGFSHMVLEEVDRLSVMLDLLERFAHPGEPVKNLESINEIIEEILVEFRNKIDEAEIKINTKFDSSHPMVEVDRNQISEAIFQIVKNSLQSLGDKGRLNITTIANREEGNVQIKIKDNGEGIPLENLKKIFLPLFTTKLRGLGIGLPLAKKVVETHGGRIDVNSFPGRGTEVSIFLPLSVEKRKLRENEKILQQEVKIEDTFNS